MTRDGGATWEKRPDLAELFTADYPGTAIQPLSPVFGGEGDGVLMTEIADLCGEPLIYTFTSSHPIRARHGS
jgi:hypothetical protein